VTDHLADVDARLRELARSLPPIGTHPDEDAWVAWQTGALSREARVAMADHIGSCHACAQVYRALSHMTGEAEAAALVPSRVEHVGAGPSKLWLALAASVVAAVAAGLWVGTQPDAPHSTAPVASVTPAPVPSAPNANVPPSTTPVRAWALAVTIPAVELPARYALATRGASADGTFLEAFGPGIAAYRAADYPTAAARLAAVVAQFPDVPEAAFYLGVSQLFAGDAAGARSSLARAERAETLGEAARWFGAAAAERVGATAEADAQLAALCRTGTVYKAQACAAAMEP
jgi:TolA-binding protein